MAQREPRKSFVTVESWKFCQGEASAFLSRETEIWMERQNGNWDMLLLDELVVLCLTTLSSYSLDQEASQFHSCVFSLHWV